MSENLTKRNVLEALIDGLQAESADRNTVLSALKPPVNCLSLASETVTFLRELVLTETPEDPEELMALSKAEVRTATYRVNFFERLRVPAHDDEQLEHLYARAQELWGEHPTEPMGRWVEWCLWVHLHRRRNDGSLSDVVFGDGSVEDIKQVWAERHEAREQRRHLRKVDNYAQYDTPQDVPDSIRHHLMSPFIEDDEMVDIEVTGSPAEPLSRDHDKV